MSPNDAYWGAVVWIVVWLLYRIGDKLDAMKGEIFSLRVDVAKEAQQAGIKSELEGVSFSLTTIQDCLDRWPHPEEASVVPEEEFR